MFSLRVWVLSIPVVILSLIFLNFYFPKFFIQEKEVTEESCSFLLNRNLLKCGDVLYETQNPYDIADFGCVKEDDGYLCGTVKFTKMVR